MKVTRITATAPAVAYRIDPHDGGCRGAHDIILEAVPTGDREQPWHVTVTWQASALLSLSGSREFAAALQYACGLGERLRRGETTEIPDDATT